MIRRWCWRSVVIFRVGPKSKMAAIAAILKNTKRTSSQVPPVQFSRYSVEMTRYHSRQSVVIFRIVSKFNMAAIGRPFWDMLHNHHSYVNFMFWTSSQIPPGGFSWNKSGMILRWCWPSVVIFRVGQKSKMAAIAAILKNTKRTSSQFHQCNLAETLWKWPGTIADKVLLGHLTLVKVTYSDRILCVVRRLSCVNNLHFRLLLKFHKWDLAETCQGWSLDDADQVLLFFGSVRNPRWPPSW